LSTGPRPAAGLIASITSRLRAVLHGPSMPKLAPQDLLRDATYRRLFSSILISSLGGQVSMLALPLTAAVLLNASPTQMGLMSAMGIVPFVLLSLPAGVWLDRRRKLPVYVVGEGVLALGLASVPLAWWMGWLSMPWMYAVVFLLGAVHVVAGSAAQIVLTQVVPRERLVEAHSKNALASSGAEVAGPGLAGALIKAVGAPVALLVDAVMLLASVAILRGVKVQERITRREEASFWLELKAGLRFVRGTPLLVAMAATVGAWQLCHHSAVVVQILFATRELGLSEQDVGLAFIGLGVGTVAASAMGRRLSARIGPGPALLLGIAVTGVGWAVCSVVPVGRLGFYGFAFMLACFGFGAALTFINFLSLRQAVTPAPLLGRMTSTMRWLILIPAGPGALLGGWLGEHFGLRASLAFAGVGALVLAAFVWRQPIIRGIRGLPDPVDVESVLGGETTVGADGVTR